MFNRIKDMGWKIPIASFVGILVLLLGIYVGIKSIDDKQEPKTATHTNVEKSKDAFYLNENCEIVINTIDDTSQETISTKIVSIPEELFNKTEQEIKEYISDIYPNTKIQSITQGEILLIEQGPEKEVNLDRKNKYSIEIEEGIIGVYKYDINGNRELQRETSQDVDSLPQMLQEEIQKGILADSIEEIDAILDSILS